MTDAYRQFLEQKVAHVRAVKHGRLGRGTELNGTYFEDAVWYLRAEENQTATPSLFDLESEISPEPA